jgi:hypothetical protein
MTPPLTQPSVFFSPPCAICFERTACERDAKHGLVSLRCGHCFGARCVETWLLTRRAKCPVCDDDACVEDIRVLFALDCIGAEDEDEDDRKGAGDSIEVELRRARETTRALREELRVLRANGASREVLGELNRDGKRGVGAASTAVGAKKTKTKSVADYFGGGGAAAARWTFEECKTMKGGVIQDGVILMDTALTRDGRAVLQVESFFDDLDGPMVRLVKRGCARGSKVTLLRQCIDDVLKNNWLRQPLILPQPSGASQIVALCVSSAVFVVNAAGQLTAVVPIESCIHAASWSPNEANMLFVAVRNRIGMSSILEYDLNSTSYRKPRKSNDFPTDAVYHSVLYFPELRTFVVGTGLTHWTMTMASDVRPDVRPVYDEREETVCVEVPGYIMRAHPSSRRIVSASTYGVVMSPTGNGQKVRVKLTTFDLIEQWGRDGGSAQLMPKVSSSILMGEYEQSDLTTYYDFSTLMCMGVLPDRSEIVAVGVGTTVEIYDSSTLALIQKFDVGGLVFRVDISPDGSLLTACSLPIGHTKGDFETHTLYKLVQGPARS